jgi:hypothetical protein
MIEERETQKWSWPKRVVFTVPIDEKAVHDFDYDVAREDQLLQLRFDGDDAIWILRSGLVPMMNEELNANIDSWEDENIADLPALEAIVPRLRARWPASEIVTKIADLCAGAVRLGTCIDVDIA